ncbi:hypothetical protein I204_01768 [Kwoniella mangroviensis CBS 8886]|nr:hypothetical protein I204_01768 [Kwoniella mangroviensis CBS 8886]
MSKGDLIIIEKPYLVLPLTEDGEEPDNKVYHKLYLNLSLEHKRIFDGLYERKDDLADKDHIVNKIDTNAIPLAQTSQDGSVVMKKMGLFEVISRVNHGCKPNAGWYWYGEEREMRLYAYTDIPAHAEITCSYLSYEQLLEPSSIRRSILLIGFGFECICKGCNQSSIDILKSDNRLIELESLRNEWSNKNIVEYCKIDDDVIKTLRKLNRSLKLLEREEKFNQLGEVYEKIFEVYAVHGSSDSSRLAANEALNHFKAIMGEKEATKTWVARQSVDPTLYPLWNKLGMIHSDSVTEHQDESEENEDDDEDKEKDMGEGGIGKVHRSRSRKWEEKSWDGSD